MARPINVLFVFTYSIMLFGLLLQSSGVAGMLGLGLQLGGQEAADSIESETGGNVETGAATGETLFGLYNVLGGRLGALLAAINPGLQMINNAGVPAFLMQDFVIPIATAIKTIGVIFFLRGISS